MANSALDRLAHHAHHIIMEGDSYRRKLSPKSLTPSTPRAVSVNGIGIPNLGCRTLAGATPFTLKGMGVCKKGDSTMGRAKQIYTPYRQTNRTGKRVKEKVARELIHEIGERLPSNRLREEVREKFLDSSRRVDAEFLDT